jgi:type I restriction enzyme S subunit
MKSDLPEGWRWVELSDLIEVHHGFAFRGEFFREAPPGDILLTPGNFAIGGGFTSAKRKYYDGPVEERFVLHEGDLLISMTDLSRNSDTLGSPALVPAAPDGIRLLHNQRLGRVEVTKPKRLNQRYLYAALRTSTYRQQVIASATGTTVKHTSPAKIKAAVIPVPPVAEQRRMASVLGALDDKIESNWRVARVLDQIGTAVYEGWASQLADTLRVPTASRVQVVLGGTPARSESDYWQGGAVAWIASARANDFRILEPTAYITERAVAESATKLLPAGTTVVAITGATMGQVSRLEIDACANQSVVGLVGDSETPDEFIFYWLRSAIPELLSKQTGAAQQHVNKGDVASLPMPDVDPELTARLSATIRPLLSATQRLLRESSLLGELRKALLPRLIAGEVRVSDSTDPAEGIEPFIQEHAA